MWEYAVLHEHDEKWVVILGEGVAKGYVEVVFEGEIKRGWQKRADAAIGNSDARKKSIRNPAKNTIWWKYEEKTWNAENPCWSMHYSSYDRVIKAFKNKTHKDHKTVVEIFGVNPKSVEFVSEGLTEPIYGAETVTQVLSKAGLDGWELVGNVPSGSNRMLRRQL